MLIDHEFKFPLTVELESIFGEKVQDEIQEPKVGEPIVGNKKVQFEACGKKKKPKADGTDEESDEEADDQSTSTTHPAAPQQAGN